VSGTWWARLSRNLTTHRPGPEVKRRRKNREAFRTVRGKREPNCEPIPATQVEKTRGGRRDRFRVKKKTERMKCRGNLNFRLRGIHEGRIDRCDGKTRETSKKRGGSQKNEGNRGKTKPRSEGGGQGQGRRKPSTKEGGSIFSKKNELLRRETRGNKGAQPEKTGGEETATKGKVVEDGPDRLLGKA